MVEQLTLGFTVATVAGQAQQDTYFVWFDPDKKYNQSSKLLDAIAAYRKKVGGAHPTEVLVNVKDAELPCYVPVQAAAFVNENYFYIPYPSA